MYKGYWITFYRSISDQEALGRYAKIAGPAIKGQGGRILARGNPTKTYEAGLNSRVVVIEFDSVEAAIRAYESPEYQACLDILKNAVERDLRIIEGE